MLRTQFSRELDVEQGSEVLQGEVAVLRREVGEKAARCDALGAKLKQAGASVRPAQPCILTTLSS